MKKSLWDGPYSEGPQGGITQSMLQPFIVCRERFRLKVVEGFTEDDGFNHFLEFGSIFHEDWNTSPNME